MGTIYLTTSNGVVTGGVEATYQLYYILKKLGHNAKLLLLSPRIHPQFHPDWLERHKQSFIPNYPNVYKKYNIDINDLVYDVEDNPNNFFLAPEIYPDMLSTFNKIQKGIWWLSVDNGLGPDQRNFLSERNTHDIWHFYQSEYAHWFLLNNRITKLAKLTDFISWEYRNLNIDLSIKQNQILYNPKKGADITTQLIQNHPEFKFIPIQNMTPDQIRELMLISKIYIDFGNHPGKDRIPREAALCGCCVIAGFKGSAMFFDDVNINTKYKFDQDLSSLPELIENIFNDFESHYNQFSFYRKQINLEEEQFELEVKKIF
jgi:hypothetical protein